VGDGVAGQVDRQPSGGEQGDAEPAGRVQVSRGAQVAAPAAIPAAWIKVPAVLV
jgi:hypothetical protein